MWDAVSGVSFNQDKLLASKQKIFLAFLQTTFTIVDAYILEQNPANIMQNGSYQLTCLSYAESIDNSLIVASSSIQFEPFSPPSPNRQGRPSFTIQSASPSDLLRTFCQGSYNYIIHVRRGSQQLVGYNFKDTRQHVQSLSNAANLTVTRTQFGVSEPPLVSTK